MDLALPTWLVKAITSPFKWAWSGIKTFRSKRRVREYLPTMQKSGAMTLLASYDMAKERGNRMFDWNEDWIGFGSFESELTLLVDEGAVSVLEAIQVGKGMKRRYRFSPWFYKYLDTRPDVIRQLRTQAS